MTDPNPKRHVKYVGATHWVARAHNRKADAGVLEGRPYENPITDAWGTK